MSTKPKLLGIEAKHITYVPAQDGTYRDALFVKEIGHFDNGEKKARLKRIDNYKRPFWITHPGKQVHKDKRDYEFASNLQKYTSTQIDLTKNIANILKDFSSGFNIRRLARSPYLYGVDVNTPTLVKSEYREKAPNLFSFNQVAAGDTETNVFSDDGEIILMSVTFKTKASLFYLKSFIDGEENVVQRTRDYAEQVIGDVLKERGIDLEIMICDTPGHIVQEALKRLHEWKPDFFTFWNMDFDITRMCEAMEREGLDPAELFSDPSVPPEFRYFEYKRGPTQKVTASGKTMSISIEDRWNWVTHPAMWQMVDSMPIYRILRVAAGKDPSYALDYILEKEELGIKKLKIKEIEGLSGLRWHEVMQTRFKIEYGVYNLFDSIALEILDEKTKDLASNISLHSKNSDYKHFNSQPKRLCDDMHFWHLRRTPQEVIGSSSDQAEDELDKHVIGHDQWIVTLPSYMAAPTGIQGVKEFPDYKTFIFVHVADLDVVSTYPNVSQLLNISRKTCKYEFCRMKGVSEHHRREVGVNLTGGRVNSVEICQKILKIPSMDDMLDEFRNEKNIPHQKTDPFFTNNVELERKPIEETYEGVDATNIDDVEVTP